MKKFLTRTFIAILVFIALILTFNKQIQWFVIKNLSEDRIENVSKTKIKENNNVKTTFNFKNVKSLGPGQIYKGMINDIPVVGKIAVPSVGVQLPISKGLSDGALSSGGGTMKENEKMGEGNYAIAGHYMTHRSYGDNGSYKEIGWLPLFSSLERTKIGDKVYITDMNYVYKYKVNYKKVVSPTSINVIDDVPGRKMITLITCADKGKNRWAIQGDLVSKNKIDEKSKKIFIKDTKKIHNNVFSMKKLLILLVILGILLLIFVFTKNKRKK